MGIGYGQIHRLWARLWARLWVSVLGYGLIHSVYEIYYSGYPRVHYSVFLLVFIVHIRLRDLLLGCSRGAEVVKEGGF